MKANGENEARRASLEGTLRWAYVDGELTASEVARFSAYLPAGERARLAGEVRFEGALSKILSAPVPRSAEAWRRALANVNGVEHPAKPARRTIRRWLGLTTIAAACAVLFLASYPRLSVKRESAERPHFLTLTDGDIGAFAAHAQINDDVPGVRNFLEKCAIPVVFDPSDSLAAGDMPYRLIGAREDHISDERVVQLLFGYAGKPAKVVIVQQASHLASKVGEAVATGDVRASCLIGDALIAVIGGSESGRLLSVVGDPLSSFDPNLAPSKTSDEARPPDATPLSG